MRVWDVATGAAARRIATGSLDVTVRLWDPKPGAELTELPGGQTTVWAVLSARTAAGSPRRARPGRVRVWALDPDDLISLARGKLTRPLTEAECLQYPHASTCPDAGG